MARYCHLESQKKLFNRFHSLLRQVINFVEAIRGRDIASSGLWFEDQADFRLAKRNTCQSQSIAKLDDINTS
jgi:hypothetical protein